MFNKPSKGRKKVVRKRNRSDSSDEEAAPHPSGAVPVAAPAVRGPAVNTFSTTKRAAVSRANVLGAVESSADAIAVSYSGGATHATEIDTADDRDARAIGERNVALNKSGVADDARVYRGQAGYKNYIEKTESQVASGKVSGTQGPIRAPKFFRAICRFDYQPDVCKDYKDTGFCGYGDSCIFLHDRSDNKTGWQLDQEFEMQEKKRQR